MTQDTIKLVLPELLEGQASGETTHNEALRILDMVVQLAVSSRITTAEPETPTNGDVYLLPTSGCTGTNWTGQDGKVAYYYDGWLFLTPRAGWRLHDNFDNTYWIYTGTIWLLKPETGLTFRYEFDDTTAAADPGAGKFRLNANDLSTATEMYVADDDKYGLDISSALQELTESFIIIRNISKIDKLIYFKTSAASDEVGYTKFTIAYQHELGSAEAVTDGDYAEISIIPNSHNASGGLQGGTTDEYYHVTSDEHALVQAGAIKGLEFSFQFNTGSIDTSTDPGG